MISELLKIIKKFKFFEIIATISNQTQMNCVWFIKNNTDITNLTLKSLVT